MYEQVEKPKENQSNTNAVSQKKSVGQSISQFVDNRPEATVQRKLQEVMNNSSQRNQTGQFQTMANKYSIQKQLIQMKLYPSARVTMIASWNPDSQPWPGSNGATGIWDGSGAVKGTKVNSGASKLCRDVEKVTADLSTQQVMGTPHMAPKRMGGKGDVNNVRPWKQTFESSNWHGTLDNKVKDEFKKMSKGTIFYEDVETDESHKRTNSWLKPLQDKHDLGDAGEDKTQLDAYLTHLKTILDYVPDSAKIKTPGGEYSASGSTFDPSPINMGRAKVALKKYNGGDLDKLTASKSKGSTTTTKKAPDILVEKAKVFATEDPKRTALASAVVLGASAVAFTSYFWTGGITAGASALALYLHKKGYI